MVPLMLQQILAGVIVIELFMLPFKLCFSIVEWKYSCFHYVYRTCYYRYYYEKAGRSLHLITTKEYQEQGVTATEQALIDLQQYLVSNPDASQKVQDKDNVQEFMYGGNHLKQTEQPESDVINAPTWWTWFVRR